MAVPTPEDLLNPSLRELSPRECLGCGCSLERLPLGVWCPQCGMRERLDVITLCGWNARVPRLTRASEWVMGVFFGALLLFLATVAAESPNGSVLAWFLAVPGLGILVGPLLRRGFARYIDGAGHPPVQCHLSSIGFAIAVGKMRGDWQTWQSNWRARVEGPDARRACWLIVEPHVGFLTVGPTGPVLKFDFDANRQQLEAIQLQITRWIAREQVGHAFEVLPVQVTGDDFKRI